MCRWMEEYIASDDDDDDGEKSDTYNPLDIILAKKGIVILCTVYSPPNPDPMIHPPRCHTLMLCMLRKDLKNGHL